MSDVTDRLDKIEAELATNQLPASLAILKRKLEQDWQPDASVLLQPGSITADLLRSAIDIGNAAITIRTGTATFTFTASADSGILAVPHGLGKIPLAVVMNAWRKPGLNAGESHIGEPTGWTSTTFDCFGRATAAGAWTNTIVVSWIAIG